MHIDDFQDLHDQSIFSVSEWFFTSIGVNDETHPNALLDQIMFVALQISFDSLCIASNLSRSLLNPSVVLSCLCVLWRKLTEDI